MAELSKDEQSMFERLKKKMEAPDAKPTTRSIRANVDLGDAAQVALARKLGFLDPDDDDDGDDDDDKGKKKGKGDDDDDDTPKRRGYFGD